MVKQYIGEKLNNMNCENMIKMMEIMQEQVRKKETEAQFLKDKQRKNRNLGMQCLLNDLHLRRGNVFGLPKSTQIVRNR